MAGRIGFRFRVAAARYRCRERPEREHLDALMAGQLDGRHAGVRERVSQARQSPTARCTSPVNLNIYTLSHA